MKVNVFMTMKYLEEAMPTPYPSEIECLKTRAVPQPSSITTPVSSRMLHTSTQ